jgi:hypothetical protein
MQEIYQLSFLVKFIFLSSLTKLLDQVVARIQAPAEAHQVHEQSLDQVGTQSLYIDLLVELLHVLGTLLGLVEHASGQVLAAGDVVPAPVSDARKVLAHQLHNAGLFLRLAVSVLNPRDYDVNVAQSASVHLFFFLEDLESNVVEIRIHFLRGGDLKQLPTRRRGYRLHSTWIFDLVHDHLHKFRRGLLTEGRIRQQGDLAQVRDQEVDVHQLGLGHGHLRHELVEVRVELLQDLERAVLGVLQLVHHVQDSQHT